MASVISACSRQVAVVGFYVEAAAMPRFVEALRSFVQELGYQANIDSGTLERGLAYAFEGSQTSLEISQFPDSQWEALFQHKDGLWLGLADLQSIAYDFKLVISQIEGVRIAEGY